MISIAMPVGPKPEHRRWLGEAMASVRAQERQASELLIIDDMADIEADEEFKRWREALEMRRIAVRVWRSPWRIGVAAAFNMCVALSSTEFVFLMGSDDTLEPELIARLEYALEHIDDETARAALFFVGVKYLDGREEDTQFLACNACMVSKTLWRTCGGFPPETAIGAPDAALISIMIANPAAGQTIGVAEGHTLYNVRSHDAQDTALRGDWQSMILDARHILTRDWKPPEWGRYDL